jgi:hypothetical protein
VQNLSGLLTAAWSRRIEKAMLRIEQSLAGPPIPLVVAHNDFTGWNTRIERGVAKVFDWEYANDEQLPLFDPLHFALAPMALHGGPPARVIRNDRTLPPVARTGAVLPASDAGFGISHQPLYPVSFGRLRMAKLAPDTGLSCACHRFHVRQLIEFDDPYEEIWTDHGCYSHLQALISAPLVPPL